MTFQVFLGNALDLAWLLFGKNANSLAVRSHGNKEGMDYA